MIGLPRALLPARPAGAAGASWEDGDGGGAGPVTQLAGRGSPATGPLHNLRRVTAGARGRQRGAIAAELRSVFLPLVFERHPVSAGSGTHLLVRIHALTMQI